MIIVRLKGGLGNQLFQYAIAYSIAKIKNTEIGVDISYFYKKNLRNYKLNSLNLENINIVDPSKLPIGIKFIKNKYVNKVLRMKKNRLIKINKSTMYLLEMSHAQLIDNIDSINTENLYMDGYFQTPLYFEKYRNELLSAIIPCYEYSNYVNELFCEIYRNNSVGVHIRRGDFLKTKVKAGYHYLLKEDYYIKAICYMKQKLVNPIFYFFSDDIQWVKENFDDNESTRIISIEEKNSDITELMLMKACKHVITANSSFSWWAAWLKDNEEAICIVPDRQYGNANMIPKNWIKI